MNAAADPVPTPVRTEIAGRTGRATSGSISGRPSFAGRWGIFAAVLLVGIPGVALFAGVPAVPAPHLAGGPTPAAPGGFSAAVSGWVPSNAGAAPAIAGATGAATSTGPGEFFTSTPIPSPSPGNQSCYRATVGAPGCVPVNDTTGPQLNLTTRGRIGLVYTAYTNDSACGAVHRRFTQTLVGFSSSRDGSAWTLPDYLGNTRCDARNATEFPSAWQPTLASLGNGTFVVAYVEYNLSSGFAPDLYAIRTCVSAAHCAYSSNVLSAALVVRESFDNGTHWTAPSLVNTSLNPNASRSEVWIPWRPSIAAFGRTVYLAWSNFTGAPALARAGGGPVAAGSSEVHLLVSRDGGATWGSRIDLPVRAGPRSYFATNPQLLVLPTGAVELAYVTNLTYFATSCCEGRYGYSTYHLDVVVASSATNGTRVAVRTVASSVPIYVGPESPHPNWFFELDPAPMLAYGARYHQLFATWSGLAPGPTCGVTQGAISSCQYDYNQSEVFLARSSGPLGPWTTSEVGPLANVGNNTQLPTVGEGESQHFLPSIAVTASGSVALQAMVVNDSVCGTYYLLYPAAATTCGAQVEVATTSADNGSTWSAPIDLSWEPSLLAQQLPDGPTTSTLAMGDLVIRAWTHSSCSTWNSTTIPSGLCSWGAAPMRAGAQVVVSVPFTGTGLTISFRSLGVPAGEPWAIDLLGNYRVGRGAVLSVSGVPTEAWMGWGVSLPGIGYGVRYTVAGALPSPEKFHSGLLIAEDFTVTYLLNLGTDPSYPQATAGPGCTSSITWDDAACSHLNYNLTPGVRSAWLAPGSVVPLAVTPNPSYCSTGCVFYEVNLTFLSWTGTGLGSANATTNSSSIVLDGPVNETANFQFVGWCLHYATSTPPTTCVTSNATITFEEQGLPADTRWGVSAWGPHDPALAPVTNLSSGPFLTLGGNVTLSETYFAPWSVDVGGQSYVGDSSPSSPIALPGQSLVLVNYSVATGPVNGTVVVQESGLTAGTAWSPRVDNTSYGLRGPRGSWSLTSGPHRFGAADVYFVNGTGYRATSIHSRAWSVPDDSWVNSSAPGQRTLNGSGMVALGFSSISELSVVINGQGSVSQPASQWWLTGSHVELAATPSPGYYFVGWTGSGTGAITGSGAVVNVTVAGPLTEVATFARAPGVRYSVVVTAQGLPGTEMFSVAFNGSLYSGTGNLTLPSVLPGTYGFAVPVAYANLSPLERFAAASVDSSLAMTSGGDLVVSGNGTVTVEFVAQFFVAIAATGPGAVSPAPGGYWENAGAKIPLLAVPAPGYALAGWNGSGSGSYTGPLRNTSAHAEGPISETAQFVWRSSIPPVTFSLTAHASGLPAGARWSLSVGSAGVAGAGPNLTLTGLNGSQVVSVPAVVIAYGDRFAADAAGPAELAVIFDRNQSLNLTFVEEYLVSVLGGVGGSVSPGSGWWAAGSVLTLSARPSGPGYAFAGWSGSAYTGPAEDHLVAVGGPINESGSFTNSNSANVVGSASAGLLPALAVLGVLAVVGVVVVGLLARRGREPPTLYVEEYIPVEPWSERTAGMDPGPGRPPET